MPQGGTPPAEGFSRRHRFTSQGSFGPVLRGSRKLRGELAVLHVVRNADGWSRLGIALTRRLIPDAVARNRIKRLLREEFRRHAVKAREFDCVVTLRVAPSDEKALLAEVRGHFDRLSSAS
jgi:ribonuclease P protein component